MFNTEDLTARELELLNWAANIERRNYILQLLPLEGESISLVIVELLSTICKLRRQQTLQQ